MFDLGKKIAGLALGGMLLAGSITGIALADTNTQSTPDQTKEQVYQEFVSDFATNLGVTQDQVTAALQATKEQMVQEQVQQGIITQEQADKILAQKGLDFEFGMGGPGGFGGKHDMTQDTNFLNNAASVLGITADELKSELQGGTKLDDIVTEKGLTLDQFFQKMPKPQHGPDMNKDAATNTDATASSN